MLEIKTEIEIASEPERLWSILTDFAAYPQWNPFVRSIQGEAKTGGRLSVSVQPEGGKPMTFRPTVLLAAPNQELRWLGHLVLPGLFDGEHYFQIAPIAPGRVLFVHGEKFSGLLVALAKTKLEGGTQAGFEAMNKAIKNRAENGQPARA
ncbi:SRPBCC domain-containing protein [Methylovulum miyakonense]|uniref:SRPBCC domain-containing protein n=1 Tax=Methylovulum miyakonense TaxID=645578 RepID=UPI000364D556|nr:SRPBCC domain-containing protein [Methylovulum miyakonense]